MSRPAILTPITRSILALAIGMAVAACSSNDDAPVSADPAVSPPPAAGAPPFQVKIIAFNDYHGNLESPGTFGQNTAVPSEQRPPVGGADIIAAHVARLKAGNPNNVVVSAGDSIGASPLISSLFHDEPAVETLNRIGLEFNSVGNHEFDRGADELLRLQRGGCKTVDGQADPDSCQGAKVGTPVPFEGATFQWLSANVLDTRTGQPLLPPYGIKRFNGVDVAFIGMTLEATPQIVTPSGVSGLAFRDEADTVNALIPELRAQGIEAIVVLIHEGGRQSGSLADINGCEGELVDTPIAGIVPRFDAAVDAVITGHTHSAYNCRLPNAGGTAIPVTSSSAFGRVLTDLDITLDPVTRDVTGATATNRLTVRNDPAIAPVAEVAAIVEGYKAQVTPIANRVIGAISQDVPNARSDGACNMPAGELIADAQLSATLGDESGNAQIAFMNGGGVRSPGFVYAGSNAGEGDGQVTYGEAFTVQPFGNSRVTMTLTSSDLKNLLEEQFAGCQGQSPSATRVLIPSGGFRYTWNGAAACAERVTDVSLALPGGRVSIVNASGAIAEPDRAWRVTVNSFLADGGDGFATLKGGSDRLGGAQDIDALSDYLAAYQSPNSAYQPANNPADEGRARISRAGNSGNCPGGSDTNP